MLRAKINYSSNLMIVVHDVHKLQSRVRSDGRRSHRVLVLKSDDGTVHYSSSPLLGKIVKGFCGAVMPILPFYSHLISSRCMHLFDSAYFGSRLVHKRTVTYQ
ncbi:hypothetical protein SAY86_007620 [Trapa natans]|uniref:Uncharacterized protein n=1 Tax=Trapa natans TaxID=22666 RepID=A0AAN7LM42_TRANT|nr:hypothetical protein SAY86_007620 [Trapa natans]